MGKKHKRLKQEKVDSDDIAESHENSVEQRTSKRSSSPKRQRHDGELCDGDELSSNSNETTVGGSRPKKRRQSDHGVDAVDERRPIDEEPPRKKKRRVTFQMDLPQPSPMSSEDDQHRKESILNDDDLLRDCYDVWLIEKPKTLSCDALASKSFTFPANGAPESSSMKLKIAGTKFLCDISRNKSVTAGRLVVPAMSTNSLIRPVTSISGRMKIVSKDPGVSAAATDSVPSSVDGVTNELEQLLHVDNANCSSSAAGLQSIRRRLEKKPERIHLTQRFLPFGVTKNITDDDDSAVAATESNNEDRLRAKGGKKKKKRKRHESDATETS